MGLLDLINRPLLLTELGVTFSICVITVVRFTEFELLAGILIVMGVKLGLAGKEMVIAAAELEVENLKKMGRSPCASWRSGAANQKVVSVCAFAFMQKNTRIIHQ